MSTLLYVAVIALLFLSSIFLVLALKLSCSDSSVYKANKETTDSFRRAIEGRMKIKNESRRESDLHFGIAIDRNSNDIVALSCLSSESIEHVIS
jgi:hypothetical protein